jgi:hypothetical protein
MKKRTEKLTLHRETLRSLNAKLLGEAGGGTGGTGFVTPPTASQYDDCTTTNAMISACIC